MIMACKRWYTRKYLDEVLVVIEDEAEDTRGLRTLNNIKTYSIKSAIFNFASAWKQVRISTLANCWKKLLLDVDPELDFKGFEAQDFHRIFQASGERDVSLDDVENWLEDNNAGPGYQVLTIGEIADTVAEEGTAESSSSSETE